MSATRVETQPAPRRLTIGAVCELLRPEFTDLSISKIRYLEDQGLLEPHRTRGGYRLFSPTDVERLRRILTLQRDAFLPLRVIRDELERAPDTPAPSSVLRRRRPAAARRGRADARGARAADRRDAGAAARARGLLADRPERRALPAGGRADRRPRPSGSPATASGRGTCGRSTRRSSARRDCSSSCSHRRSARATPSARAPASRISRRSPASAPI